MHADRRFQFGRTIGSLLIAFLCAFSATGNAEAAQVSVEVSSRGVYTNIQFTLIIKITNAGSFEMPDIPQMDGIELRSGPSTSESTQISNFNGRMTRRRNVELRYQLVVRDEGQYTIPPITVQADGQQSVSAPIPITATSPGAGPELRAELVTPDSVYVGQPIELTLHVWVKPFASEQFGVRTTAAQMWGLVQRDASDWGPFKSAVDQYNTLDPRRQLPPVREVFETMPDGQRQAYYQYELSATQWPQSAGTLEYDPVRVIVAYPISLERSKDMFRRDDLTIAEWKPMLHSIERTSVEVLSPPMQGQPDIFAGAVGDFAMSVRAEPRYVAVGDPLTLTIAITDKTNGDVQLELLQPPPLGRVDELTESFRLPAEPLTGEVRKPTKTFRQTIRAMRSDVTEIPSIPFAFFDPNKQQYVVLRSQPIPISVESAQAIGAGDVEGASTVEQPESTELTELAGGILANKTGDAVLQRDQRFRLHWLHWAILIVPPLVFAGLAIARSRSQKWNSDIAARRTRTARQNAVKRLNEARRSAEAQQADLVVAALNGYVADRVNVPAEAMVRTDVITRLNDCNASEDLVRDVEQLLEECDARRFGSSANGDGAAMIDRAMSCIEMLERGRSR